MAKFNDYKDYLIVRDNQQIPGSVYEAKTTTTSGFLEFKPRDMVTQRKYDAMSPAWEGVESSNKAVATGVYALDSAEKSRIKPTATAVVKVKSTWDTILEYFNTFFFPTR
jgi:hypothetical protein